MNLLLERPARDARESERLAFCEELKRVVAKAMLERAGVKPEGGEGRRQSLT